METPSQHDRVRNIYQMLFEMATGNFEFRIRKSGHDDELGELAETLNAIAGAMRRVVNDSGYVIPHYTYQSLVQTTFVLDNNFIIKGLSANVAAMLRYRPEMLFNVNFSDLLSIQCIEYWEIIREEATTDNFYHNTIQLKFLTANRQIVPAFCTVSRLLYSETILVSSVTTILQDAFSDQIKMNNENEPLSDSALIQKVYDYIKDHLEEPLPTLKELSKLFSTNEFKIKDGFRHFFNTSVYQFYNDERLKKAHLLIQLSNESLKTIAFSCGYNDYTNFYKSFKKKFGYSPSDLARKQS